MSTFDLRVRRVPGPPLVSARLWLWGGLRLEPLPGAGLLTGRLLGEGTQRRSFERIADPANESPYAGDWAELKEVEVKDKLSGLIHLKNKFVPLWTTTLPTPASCILSRKAVGELVGNLRAVGIAQHVENEDHTAHAS